MPVHGNVPQAPILPVVLVVHAHAHQVRHDVGQAVIMIAFHPDDFDPALGIRQLADIAEEFPVLLGKPGEIQIGKDVAQQDQALEAAFLEQTGGFPRMARLRAEVQVGKDQRVVDMRIHALIVAGNCYGVMNSASILVHR